MRYLIIGAFTLLTNFLFAQTYPTLGWEPLEVPNSYVELIESGTESGIAAYSGDHRKELAEIFERRDEGVLSLYTSGLLLTESYWKDHIDGILDRIWTANPKYKDPGLEVYYTLNPNANAACYGQGLIIVNLGLFSYIKSEDELAFVLCHEIAHHHLNHVNTRIYTAIDKLFSEELQQQLRKLKRQQYNVLDSVKELEFDFSFDFARHTRYGEQEADSLGLALYQNAGYNTEGPLTLLTEVLAKADTTHHTTKLDLATLLNTSEFPFKKSWIAKPPPSPFARTTYLSKAERDSLRTHPDTEVRFAKLNEVIQHVPTQQQLGKDVSSRQREASKVFVASYFNYDRLGASLYESLRLLDSPDAVWAKGIAALSLYRLAVARENRTFSKYARLPRERTFDEGYEEVLRMLHAMRLSELKALAAAYAKTHAQDFSTCGEELALARVLTSTLGDESPADRSRLQAEFRKTFPTSTYHSLLRSKDDPWVETN